MACFMVVALAQARDVPADHPPMQFLFSAFIGIASIPDDAEIDPEIISTFIPEIQRIYTEIDPLGQFSIVNILCVVPYQAPRLALLPSAFFNTPFRFLKQTVFLNNKGGFDLHRMPRVDLVARITPDIPTFGMIATKEPEPHTIESIRALTRQEHDAVDRLIRTAYAAGIQFATDRE